MSGPGHPADPFASTTNAGEYVPREASEAALESAEWALRSGRRTLALTGPAGMGKTLLLRVLEQRLGSDFRVVYAPYAALPSDELCAWLLGLLDEKSEGAPEQELVDYARRCAEQTQGLVAMIDDAASLPLATARRLGALVAEAEGALRLVLVCADESPGERLFPALGAVLEEVRLDEPMSLDETRHYVERRLGRARAPEAVRARFEPDTVAALHQRSRGIPGVLHQLASELVRGREAEALLGELPQPAEPVPGWALEDEEEDDLSPTVPPQFRRRGGIPVQALPRTRLLLAATGLLALAALLLPWLRSAAPTQSPDPAPPPPAAPVEERVAIPPPAPPLTPPPAAEPLVPEAAGARAGVPAAAPGEASAEAPAPAPPAPAGTAAAPAPEAAAPAPAPTTFHSVNINATPWARIAVDGVALGETPLAGIPLLSGRHTITATLPDGRVEERVVEVDAENRFFSFGP